MKRADGERRKGRRGAEVKVKVKMRTRPSRVLNEPVRGKCRFPSQKSVWTPRTPCKIKPPTSLRANSSPIGKAQKIDAG